MKRLIQNTLDLFHAVLIVICDAVILYACFWLGYQLWSVSPFRHKPNIPEFNPSHILLYVMLIEAFLIWGGTHERKASVSHVLRLKDIVKYCLMGFVGSILVSFFTKFMQVGRLQVFLTFCIMIPCITLERDLLDKLWTKFIVRKFLLKRIVIYGAGNTGKRLAKSIVKSPKMGYRVLGFFDDHKSNKSVIMADPLPVLGGRDKFVLYLKKKRKLLDEVTIAMPAANTREIKRVMNICQENGVPFKFVPNLNDLMLHRVVQEQLDGIPLFSIGELNISVLNRFVKRIFDVCFSFFILLLSLPVVGIVCAVIRRDSHGPAIFKQKRIGTKGREFVMYKFRTMFQNTPPYFWHPQKNRDPRITRVGRFLRKTSLDEFPQFWNVLKGDMSIVGPRPEMPFIVKTYTTYQRERLNAKPGITGLWQISGDRSLPIHENIDHDLYYIAHQSFLLDVVIVLQTVWFSVIRGVGAK